jgi:hypothetical protein
MADPVSLSAGAIAVLVSTKALEKTGEKLSESTWNLVAKFLTFLRRRDPTTAKAIESLSQNPALADQQPENYSIPVLVCRVEEAAEEDLDIQQTLQALVDAVQFEPGAVVNMTKLAEKIGVVVQGGKADFRGAIFNI